MFFCTLALLGTWGTSSCEDEDDSDMPDGELVIPSTAYSISPYSFVPDGGGLEVYVRPQFTENFGVLGCSITNVTYYIDGTYAGSGTESPFDLEFVSKNATGGTHTLRTLFTVSGKGFKETQVEVNDQFTAITPAAYNEQNFYPDYTYDKNIVAGERMHARLMMYDAEAAGFSIQSVKYYWDNNLVSIATKAPFALDFLPDTKPGELHTLKTEITYSKGTRGRSIVIGRSVSVTDGSKTCLEAHLPERLGYASNGDKIYLTARILEGREKKGKHELKVFLDDAIVERGTTFPYEFTYTLKNLRKGLHTLGYTWETGDGEDGAPGLADTRIFVVTK